MSEFNIRPISRADIYSTGDFEPVVLGKDPTEPITAALSQEVVGQDEGVAAVAEFIVQAQARGSRRPDNVDSFLFFGPTGVGKTELVKAAAKLLGWPLIMVKGTELKNESSVTRLKGADPTLIGYGDPPLINSSMLKNPAVVCVDETEKMHKAVREWWMDVIEDGEATIFESNGKPAKAGHKAEEIVPTKLNFRGSAVFFTSNEGAGQMADEYRTAAKGPICFPGVRPAEDPRKNLKKIAYAALETGTFREQPEFLGRIERKVLFQYLQPEHYSAILDKFIRRELERLVSSGLPVMVQPTIELRELALNQAGTGPYGARTLRDFVRKVFRKVEKYGTVGSLAPNHMYYADMDDTGEIIFHKLKQETMPIGIILPDGTISSRPMMKPAAEFGAEKSMPLALPAPSESPSSISG
jgi:ATP-dependent Clp protease ATP-binding subunit ClpA